MDQRLASLVLAVWIAATAGAQPPRPTAAEVPGTAAQVPGPAAEAPGALTDAAALTAEQIQSRLEYLKGNEDLDKAARAKAIEDYQAALTATKAAASWANAAQEQAALAEKVPQQQRELDDQGAAAARSRADHREAAYAATSLAELEDLLQTRKTELEKARNDREAVIKELARREGRLTVIPEQIAAASQRLTTLEGQLSTPPGEDTPAEVLDARSTMLAAERLAAQNEIDAMRKELAYYDASRELIRKRRDLLEARVKAVQEDAEQLRRLVDSRRHRDAAQQVKEARARVDQVAPPLKPAARHNLQLAQQRLALTAKLQRAQREANETDKQISDLSAQFVYTQTQINKLSEMTEAIGALLRRQRQELPGIRKRQRTAQDHQTQLRNALGAQLRLQEDQHNNENEQLAAAARIRRLLVELQRRLAAWQPQLAEETSRKLEAIQQSTAQPPSSDFLQPYADLVDSITLEMQPDSPSEIRKALQQFRSEQQLAELLITRGTYLEYLATDYKGYFNILFNLAIDDRQLIDLIQQYREFVDERALWICSTDALSVDDFGYAWNAVRELTEPQTWRQLTQQSWLQLIHYWWMVAVALAVLGPLYLYGVRLRKVITDLGQKAGSNTCRSFRITLKASLLTLAISLIWPVLLLLAGLWLRWMPYSRETVGLARQLGAALMTAAVVYFPLEVWRQMMRDDGVCERHLDVPTSAVRIMRRNLRWLTLVIVPLLIIQALVSFDGRPLWDRSLGRFAFLATMLAAAFFLHRLMHPARGAIRNLLAYRRGSLADRLRRVWYVVVVGIPLVLAGLSAIGYHLTAQQLAVRLLRTVFLVLAIGWIAGLLRRWLLVKRRHLAMQQARERLAQRAQEMQTEGAGGAAATDTSGLNLSAIDQQTRTLLNVLTAAAVIVGLWLIWVDVLPALSRFDKWEAWTTYVEVQQPAAAGGGAEAAATVKRVEMISVADVGLSLLVFAATIVATKNIPGLIELTLLQRLPMDRALRFAITTVTRYVIFLVGVVWALTNLGITWSKVQWLVAGVGVGLGFGLQEIFANFMSGLIILFERKMRTGDIVTVGDVSGVVTDIRMRATTIEDWDKKELVVPNKEFITGKLLNWTLSDSINRVVVEVGIAYGSDVEKARHIILETARLHPEILADPPPSVIFDGFLDSSLHLTLRAYLPSLEHRLQTINDLHTAIHEALREAGIEIPFPQRDLNFRLKDLPLALPGNGENRSSSGVKRLSAN